MSKLHVIVGSTRPARAADRVVPWVVERAADHGAFELEVLDLRDWPLPLFQEHRGSIGEFSDPTYSDPIVRAWNRKVKEADAFLVITPEHLHGVPGALKNALDNVFVSFAMRNKPLATVAYSGGVAAGVRAAEHLALIAIEAEAVPLRNTVVIPFVESAFDEQDRPKDPMTDLAMTVLLDDLAWWSALLEKGRADGELAPGTVRRTAAAALSAFLVAGGVLVATAQQAGASQEFSVTAHQTNLGRVRLQHQRAGGVRRHHRRWDVRLLPRHRHGAPGGAAERRHRGQQHPGLTPVPGRGAPDAPRLQPARPMLTATSRWRRPKL